MGHWNHRILAYEYEGHVEFKIHEVFYDNNGLPNGYTMEPVSISTYSVEDISWTLEMMLNSTKKPVLWAGEKFPNEYPN